MLVLFIYVRYRVDPGIAAFALGGISTLAIALLTVGLQVFKVAWANPVKALRHE